MSDTCTWAEDWEGVWRTTCDNAFEFMVDGPTENGVKFCCYCGKPVDVKPYLECSYCCIQIDSPQLAAKDMALFCSDECAKEYEEENTP